MWNLYKAGCIVLFTFTRTFSFSRSSSDRAKSSLSEHISSDSNRLLCSNTAHLLVLTVDDIVSMNGGLESLLMQSTSPGGTQEVKIKV